MEKVSGQTTVEMGVRQVFRSVPLAFIVGTRVDEASGQGQAGGGGQVMFSAPTPRHPGNPPQRPLISRNESCAGQVGAVGRWACLSLRSSAESRCQAP